MRSRIQGWLERLKPVYGRLNLLSGGSLEILRCAAASFHKVRAGEAATSIAFFALFSLFPMLIFLVTGASLFLQSGEVRGQLFFYIQTILPISQRFILDIVDAVLFERPAIGPLALIGLLWSATGVFSTLALHINRAWSEAQVRNFLHSRLVALTMVGILIGLLFLSLLTSTILTLLVHVRIPLGGSIGIYENIVFILVAAVLPFLIRLGLLYGLYRWIPTTNVRGNAAFWGALTATILWEIITRAFTWYLSSDFNRYEQTYGALATMVALMFYIYLGSWGVLYGAHVTAAISVPNKLDEYRLISKIRSRE